MASQHEVKCVSKSERYNPHERITHIGGVNGDGTNWKLPQEKAIGGIESGQWDFYVNRGGRTARVVVALSRFGHKYLKTEADGEMPDNLLSLFECK
jgi:hypothetical protein